METLSKAFHDKPMTMPPHTLLSKCLRLTLLEFLRFSSLLIVLCIETYFMLQEWNPICHLLLPLSCFLLLFIFKHFLSGPPSVYLVDFSCLSPPNFCRAPFSSFLEHASAIDCFDAESVSFMARILHSSGQGQHTYLPPPLHYIPPRTHHNDSMKEAQMLLFPIMDDLLSKTQLSPSQIDILILNCSGFCPVPSLSSLIINKYSMKDSIKSFNISGMGCSAGTLGINLAQNLLKLSKDSYAIVVSTEILSSGWYAGKERPKLLLNCLFRMGASAALLTNVKGASKTSKYKLVKTLRTQRAFDDRAHNSAIREEDASGATGVHLNRELLHVAGETLHHNVSVIAPSILPLSENLRLAASFLRRRRRRLLPDFKTAVQHFCLPASGRAVIAEIGRGLGLSERDIEPTAMTLHRFGNQSAASMWYEVAYLEAKERVKKGDRVWQLGMGSGPKCNSVIWECLRPITGESTKGPWADTIHLYPISAVDPA